MASDEVRPTGQSSGAGVDGAPHDGADPEAPRTTSADALPDGWWQHVLPAYMPAGAWKPHLEGESTLTAPVAPGAWMPPVSSFHALRPGSSLATESGEPVVPTLAALASATTIPGLAHGTSIDLSALDDAIPTLAEMTASAPDGASALDRVREATEQAEGLSERVPDSVTQAVRAYDPAAFDRAQSAIARYGNEGGVATAFADASRAAGIAPDATPRQAAQQVKQLASGIRRPVVPTSVIEGYRAQIGRLVTVSAVLAAAVLLLAFVFYNPYDEWAGLVLLSLIGVGLVQAGCFIWAIVVAARGRVLGMPVEGRRPLHAMILLSLCSPIPVLLLRFVVEAF